MVVPISVGAGISGGIDAELEEVADLLGLTLRSSYQISYQVSPDEPQVDCPPQIIEATIVSGTRWYDLNDDGVQTLDELFSHGCTASAFSAWSIDIRPGGWVSVSVEAP